MSRTKDTLNAIEGIRNESNLTETNFEEIKIALIGHIALSLAVIADKLTGEEAEGSEDEQNR